jgi:hypothetical protein
MEAPPSSQSFMNMRKKCQGLQNLAKVGQLSDSTKEGKGNF